ncbi:hypothetical protein D3C87_795910 [compost metagenome]
MDRRERDGDAQAAMLAALAGKQSEIWTALPCVVTSALDPDKRTISCQPVIKSRAQAKDGSFSWVTLPLLVDVLVYFPEGGGVTMTFPVKPGDECLVVLACRCIDDWWQKGGIQSQPDLRMHDLSDGFAFVGVSSLPRVIANISTSRAQFRSNDGEAFIEIDPESHLIRAKTSGDMEAEVDGNVTATVEGDVEATVSGALTATVTGDVLVETLANMRLKAAGTLTLEAGALISLLAPSVNLTAYPGSVTSIDGGSFSVNNTNWSYTGGSLTFAGTPITSDGRRIDGTHTHPGGTIGAGNTDPPNA